MLRKPGCLLAVVRSFNAYTRTVAIGDEREDALYMTRQTADLIVEIHHDGPMNASKVLPGELDKLFIEQELRK